MMNLALIAGQIQTKYLNKIFIIERGNYGELGILMIVSLIMGVVIPISAIILFGRRI